MRYPILNSFSDYNLFDNVGLKYYKDLQNLSSLIKDRISKAKMEEAL